MASSEALLGQTIRRLAAEFPNRSVAHRWLRGLVTAAVVGVGAAALTIGQNFELYGPEADWDELREGPWLLAIVLIGRLGKAEALVLMVAFTAVLAAVYSEGRAPIFHTGEVIAAGLIMASWTTRWRYRRPSHRAGFGRSSPRRHSVRSAAAERNDMVLDVTRTRPAWLAR
jgi:hypothetical protein